MPPNAPEARVLTKDFAAVSIAHNIANDGDSTATKLASLIKTGQARITTAQSIVDNAAGSEAFKIGKDAVASLLAPVKEVVAILDLVGSVHPAVSAAVAVVKIVVQLELNRLDNDKHIAALYFSMSDLLFVLAYLDPVFKDNDGLKSQLEKQLKDITANINSFGNFCDEYYKHKSVVRTIFSTRYKGQLADFAKNFTDQKSELQFLITQKSAATVTAMKGSLDSMTKKMDKLVQFLDKKSPDEQKVADMVANHGGEAAVVGDEKLLNSIASKLGEKMTSDIKQDMKFTLRSSLDEALQANQAMYNLKFDAIRSQLEHAIQHSTETILSRLDSGPHDLIHDEDIRTTWKDMQWRLSCKVRHFVDAVHHHFSQKFLLHQRTTGQIHPDFWTLNYMSKVIFHPAIGDAIDGDSSGYLSVTEVDRFFQKKPKEWSSSEWIAYWAAGWYKNTILFKHRCMALIASLEAGHATVVPANKEYLEWYYTDKEGLPAIRLIVDSIYTNVLGYHGERFAGGSERLHALRSERMASEIESMKSQLSKPKYQLDDEDSVLAVCGTQQMELSFMPLTYLLLLRHKKILDLAQKYVLSDEEFWTMGQSLFSLQGAFDKRYRDLMEGWRQQRLNIDVQLQSFAAGMFEAWHVEYYEDDDSDSDSESEGESEASGTDNEEGNDQEEATAEAEQPVDGSGDKDDAPDTKQRDGEDKDEAKEVVGTEAKSEPTSTDGGEESDESSSDESDDGDDASVVDEKAAAEEESGDPLDILVFALPTPQPEVVEKPAQVTGNEEADDDEDEETAAPKKRKQTKLERRVAAIETKLNSIEKILKDAKLDGIEKLLQEVLLATKGNTQP